MTTKNLRIVGAVVAVLGIVFSTIGFLRAGNDNPGPWASLGLLFVVLTLALVALVVRRDRR